LLAPPFFQPESDPPKEGNIPVEISDQISNSSLDPLNPVKSAEVFKASSDEYAHLQRRIFMATIFLSAFAIGITAIFFDLQITTSLLVGSFLGLLYLRLLARSIEKLGKSSKQVGKIQLLVPVLLVLATSKLPQLDLIPALLGFVLYKPALIFQTFLETRS